MADPTGETKAEALRLDFDRRLRLQFHGSVITSDGGLLAYRELDDVLALTMSGGERLAEARTGKNRRHLLVGLLRQSVFGRLAGYEDVNDAERLCHDPAMRWVVGGGRQRLQRTFRLHVLPSAVRVQPTRRSGAVRSAVRQCAQRRRLAGRAGASGRPLPGHREAALFPR
jgi:Transposase DDE domain group 1